MGARKYLFENNLQNISEGKMMKRKHIQGIIGLAIFILFANQAWAAAELIPYATSDMGYHYYNKNSISKDNKGIVSVWTKGLLNDNGKKVYFKMLKDDEQKAPDVPDKISHIVLMNEFDCANGKARYGSFILFDNKNNVIYSGIEDDEWKDIKPGTNNEALKKIACDSGKISKVTNNSKISREELRAFVNERAKNLPIRLDSITTLTNIILKSDDTILFKYRFDKDAMIKLMAESEGISVREFQKNAISQYGSFDTYINMRKTRMEDDVSRGQCRTTIIRNYIDGGVIFKHAYYEKRGPLFLEVIIDKNKCSKY
jgi:hypothetical protein